MRKKIIAIIVTICLLFSSIPALGHSGRTDSSGGHRDNKNVSGLGYYHYHCGGYPAHLHKNGVCPYKGQYVSNDFTEIILANNPNATTRLSTPKVTPEGKKNSIYLSWDSVNKATSYRVFRSTSKNGTYKKIAETKKLYYYDKTAKKNKTYYYKVKAYSTNSQYTKSKYSSIVKAKRIDFKGKLDISWSSDDPLEQDISNTRTLGIGQVEWLSVNASGSDETITVEYPADYLAVEWQYDSDGSLWLQVSVENYETYDVQADISIYYVGHKSKGVTIPIIIDKVREFKPYVEFPLVPDFGSYIGVEPLTSDFVGDRKAYFYTFSSITNAGFDPISHMNTYIEKLKGEGFYVSESFPYQSGWFYTLKSGLNTVSVQTAYGSADPAIIVGVLY